MTDGLGSIGKMMILIGAFLVVAGILLIVFQKIPFLGKLPGDILIKKDRFTLYFPLATSIILSILISLVLYLIGKFMK